MSEAVSGKRQVPEASRAASEHCRNLEPQEVSAQMLNNLIADLVQHDTPANVAALFENRASIHTIRSWRNGNRYVAPWALELIENKAARVAQTVKQMPRGPGKQAGEKNLIRRWR
jgi:hypothetical protein